MSSTPPQYGPENRYLRAFEKAEARKKSGCDPLAADWQAILEIALHLAWRHLRDNPGRLLPLQIGSHEEWEFYLDVRERLDLPPDTYAVLSTPSFSHSLLEALDEQDLASGDCKEMPWGKNAYLIIISDCNDHARIMQVSLPSASGKAGIDVYEDGRHLADYTYHTIEECMDALAKVPWIFFSPKGTWTEAQIIQYTENWFVKSFEIGNPENMVIHSHFSYAHHPELINLSPLESAFKLLEVTVSGALENLESAIETTNDLNRDLGLPKEAVTRVRILSDDPEPCQALAGRIAIEMDQQLDAMKRVQGIAFPDRNDPRYGPLFVETAKRIYEKTAGRPCPGFVKVR